MRDDDRHKAGTLLGQLDDVQEAVDRARLILDAVRASWARHDRAFGEATVAGRDAELDHLQKLDHLVQVLENSSALAVLHSSRLLDAGTPLAASS